MPFEQPSFDSNRIESTADETVSQAEQPDTAQRDQQERKPLQPSNRQEHSNKLEQENDQKKLNEISNAIEEQSDPAQDKAFAEELEKKIAGVDGEQVLREAAAGLPPLYNEVFSAGLQGPPPVEQKDLGTTFVKMSLAAGEMGEAIKASMPPSMGFIANMITQRAATPSFAVRAFIEGSIEDAEGVQRKKGESDGKLDAAIENIAKKYNKALKPAEKKSKKDFTENMDRFLKKGKAEGRSFLTARERKDASDGGGYALNWIMRKTFAEIGIYKDFEKMGKDEASPVSVAFEQPAQNAGAGPNLVMKQKNGKDAKPFMDQVTKAIGSDRVKKSGDTWSVKEITAKELEKVGKILQAKIQKTDPRVEQRA